MEKLEKKLRKRRVFDDLKKLSMSLGIAQPKDLVRLDEAAPKMQEAWKGSSDDFQTFVFYLEALKVKFEFDRKINEARAARALKI